MCGIVGIQHSTNSASQVQARLNASIQILKRRGPNDDGVQFFPTSTGVFALGHTRLSVIDLSTAGHQPMQSKDARYALVFNGEIYNYRELRVELEARGHAFFTASDTEVLLQAWVHWGREALPRLTGMFAFAVFDSQEQSLTLERDPFGIKPLYYSQSTHGFCFASEIPAVTALVGAASSLNVQQAYNYLVHGDYDSSGSTFSQDVHALLPGYVMQIDLIGRRVSTTRWWRPRVQPVQQLSITEAAHLLRNKFLDNVRMHLRSDVPLGAALSGGVDSSAIVCAMRRIEPSAAIHTFSFIAPGSVLSEENWIDLVNAHVGAVAHKVVVQPHELATDLDDMIAAQGEPFGSTSIYAQYRVFKLARECGITVTLDGQGADELLAGYSGYPGKRAHSLLDEGKLLGACQFLRQWSNWPDRPLMEGVKATIAEYVNGGTFQLLRQANGARLCPTWLDEGLLRDAGVRLEFPRHAAELSEPGRRLAAALAQSIGGAGLPALLRHGDRNSMRFSVESRVPFLTADIANFLLTLPEEYLISAQGETKNVLRLAMRGIVPDAVLDRRDKIGFATPEKDWLMQMAPQVREWLREPIDVPFFRQVEVLKAFDEVVAGRRPFSWQVWRWINFTRWYARQMQA